MIEKTIEENMAEARVTWGNVIKSLEAKIENGSLSKEHGLNEINKVKEICANYEAEFEKSTELLKTY